jgi:hypothetical protein
VEVRRVRSEPVSRHSGVVSDLQTEPAARVGGPSRPVFGAMTAATCADRDGRSRIGPLQYEADICAMTASVNAPIRDWVGHHLVDLLRFPRATSVASASSRCTQK